MSSKRRILRNKIPYVDDVNSTEEVVNYIARTLNSSFYEKEQVTVSKPVTVNSLDGATFEQSYSSAGIATGTFTFTHNFGAIPSGWILLDSTHTAIVAGGAGFNIWRSAWTTTTITISIILDSNTTPMSGSFKILVLR